MQELSTALLRALGLRQMTEREAYAAYTGHVGACRQGCEPRSTTRCKAGLRLHDDWKRMERQEAPRVPAGAGRKR